MKHRTPLALLALAWLTLAGCAGSAAPPATEPSPTPFTIIVDGQVIVLVPGENILPEIYEAAQNPEMLEHNDWIFADGYWDLMPKGVLFPLEAEAPLWEAPAWPSFPGAPQAWGVQFLPELGVAVDVPEGWEVRLAGSGVEISSPDGGFQFRLLPHPNPENASLAVWLAAFAPTDEAEMLAETEDMAGGIPVVLQRVRLLENEADQPGEHLVVWLPLGDRVFQWTGWPGLQPETYDLLMFMTASLR